MRPAPLLCRHAANHAGRDFVVGDLHGCVDPLRVLLHDARFDAARDRLFSVGDLVDRGEQPEAALALLDRPWFFPVLGNHEDVLCAVAEGALAMSVWERIGGAWAAHLPAEALARHARRLRMLPLVRSIGDGAARFHILHAEFFGDDAALARGDYDDATRQRLLWGRELVYGRADPARQAGLSPTYCGHTPVHEVMRIGAQTFVDTGAFDRSGKLTLLEVESGRCWAISVAAARFRGAADLPLP
ncbi:metallophosphoesterase [Burkholderia sp. FERM BP-3421]|jgi:serine/threonine protein phosphatase 1|uniref:metallophosphoesterase n=1 Tax=Burkholderia sp. FERM BP-3421 TaxID=1494466 RepID=UPI0023613F3C|nr:metallophosphoesterase [Burkholderia sp. FERM BP-3421]WDD92886.1 metallophosphoesterase [Burkholderia sp. FERM BP-3421]